MSTFQLALLSDTQRLDFAEVQRVARAIQRQLTEHFTPVWGRSAVISAVDQIEHLPPNTSPIIIKDDVPGNQVFGFHRVEKHDWADPSDDQPFAVVEYDRDWWPLDASHECLEMIIDPVGSALRSALSPRNLGVEVTYLVEICDPCGRREAHYDVDNAPLCDFYTPEWFDPVPRAGVRYSYKDRISGPRALLPGGYVSYWQPAITSLGLSEGWHMTLFDGSNYAHVPIGPPDLSASLREWIDMKSEPFLSRDAALPETRAALRVASRHYRSERLKMAKVQRAAARRWRRSLRGYCDQLAA